MKCLLIVALSGLLLAGCSASPTAPPTLTGDQVATAIKASGLPVDGVVVRTAETDPNKLLGRPNQYVGKMSWFDTRIEPRDDLSIASAEIFSNSADMETRFKTVDAMSKSSSMFALYIFRNDSRRVLLYLPTDLTPTQAEEYKTWLGTL